MNTYLLGGAAAVVLAGGAYLLLSGNGSSDDAEDNTVSNAVSTPGDAPDINANVNNGGGQKTGQKVSENKPQNSSSSSSGTPRLHPVEKMCITYVSSGQVMNGTTTSCHRKWAYERYEIVYSEVGFAGITQTQNQHTIYIGDQIYAIDLDKNTGTQTTSPAYAGLAAAMRNSDPSQMSATFIASMGFTPTGESKTIANMDCDGYSAAQLGTACLTPEGVMLEQEFMGNRQVAESVTFSEGGDDRNYTLYQKVPITEGPDLSNGIGGLMDQFGGNN